MLDIIDPFKLTVISSNRTVSALIKYISNDNEKLLVENCESSKKMLSNMSMYLGHILSLID